MKLATFGGEVNDKNCLRHDANVRTITGFEADGTLSGVRRAMIMKQFRLNLMPVYRRKTDPENVTTTIAPEPNARTKMVEAQNLDDLLEQVRGFGAEYGKAWTYL